MTTQALSIGCRDIRHSYKTGFTLEVPEVSVSAGSTLALLGPSGAGKSTLLSVLGLLEQPRAGEVRLGDRVVGVRDRDARLQMAAVFQRAFLFKGTVSANVAFGLKLRRIDGKHRLERVRDALARVGLVGYEDRSALTLSGGEAQRVALARALVLDPRVLLLDEPLASLDPILKRRLSEDFSEILSEEGVTTVYVTHDQDEAMIVADRVAIMNEGRIVSEGPVDQVMGVPADDWTAHFLGIEPSLRGVVESVTNGLASVRCGGAQLFAVGHPKAGTEVLLGVRPEDVLLFAVDEELPVSSARNRLRGKVAELAPRGATWHVTVASGSVRLVSSVSRAAVAEMRLEKGTPVLAVFKATAVRIGSVVEAGVGTE